MPAGLSFDPASRNLTGTPGERGEHSMTYTATDANGAQIAVSFQIVIRATALQVNGASAPEKPGTPTLTRKTFSEPTDPALDVTWTAPASGATPTGYAAQYRKKAAEGQDPAQWTAYSGTLGATATSLTLSDLEAGATYEVQVQALNNEARGPWSDTGSGRANRAPTATSASFLGGTFSVGTKVDYRETGNGALGVMFADADGDALTYSAAAQHPALVGVSLSGAAGQAHLRATLLNQGSSKVTYTATDPYGGSVTRTATLMITAKESRSIAENSAAGTAVGNPVTGTPYNGVALSYTLKGKAKDSGKFVIDSASGQISVAQGATLDYETDNSNRETETFNGQIIAKFYRGEVHYTVDGHAAVISVSIKVTD
ncbi:MAG: fibronectin type III domain-containing protein, partial [Chloroflexi bacterium]|nr:fibronectin type III domain-containing protein [Chloroflexota bacterium]